MVIDFGLLYSLPTMWGIQLNMIANFADLLSNHIDDVHMGVVKYSSLEFSLDTYLDLSELKKAVLAIEYEEDAADLLKSFEVRVIFLKINVIDILLQSE